MRASNPFLRPPARGSVPWVGLALLALAAVIATVFLSRPALDDAAVLGRLETVWPGVHDLPAADRDYLAALARHCGLARTPHDPAVARACLHEAATQPHVGVPDRGVPPAAVLDDILQRAAPSQAAAAHPEMKEDPK